MKRNRCVNIFLSGLIFLMLSGAAGAAQTDPDVEAFEDALASFTDDEC